MEWGGDEFRLFRPTPPRLSLSSSHPALLRVIIANFSYPKPYNLNKHINISLFYFTQCDSLPLFYYVLSMSFFFFFVIVLLNTWIYYSIFFFLKNDLIWWDKFSCTFKYIFINEIGFIKKIVLVIGQINKKIKFYMMGWGFVGPQWVGIGWEIFPCPALE